jgi:hypothetical protein
MMADMPQLAGAVELPLAKAKIFTAESLCRQFLNQDVWLLF